ncbi:prolipoprotein diacylglyceryl transferase [Tissierella creatinophila]|uniref:Phosphatidylglycerol--prolipoprotein diacylglyceryl transferase n=1 Tax=Tissierella creatinophila DSM 6911 TaxID=1123403 RepID=A0A1U7M960_TISCR|nr:prolipoprotein diacylglyceryl transferase [Tissierella creatinophila]OLS03874.1 prolipoprotein diacylglyceryl transferase [Tissierella creatinophila DSM 6911]
MNPVAFEIFGLPIRWYGIFIASAVFLGTIIALKQAKLNNIEENDLLDLLLYAIPVSIIGARAYYVIFSWDLYRDDLIQVLNFRNGGLAIHGVLIGAIVTTIIFTKKRNISFWKLVDTAAPSLVLGQAIGRWGNFVNQEAHGGPTDLPWGIIVDGVKVHPTFLYESLWNFGVFIFLMWYSRNKKHVDGAVFLWYLILYSFIRFFIEHLRTDSLMWGSVKVAQLISVIIIIVSSYMLYKKKK